MNQKRLLDLTCSLFVIAITAPLWLAVALAIELEDGSPVFFRQVRVGRGGRLFKVIKFRSMRKLKSEGSLITSAGDSRVTRVGRIIRKYKLDELPQFLNVLAGEMSIVGPRPEVPKYVNHYTSAELPVLELMPGITDEATIFFRSEEALLASVDDPEAFYIASIVPKKASLSLAYAKSATPVKDIEVIIRTLAAITLPAGRKLVTRSPGGGNPGWQGEHEAD